MTYRTGVFRALSVEQSGWLVRLEKPLLHPYTSQLVFLGVFGARLSRRWKAPRRGGQDVKGGLPHLEEEEEERGEQQ